MSANRLAILIALVIAIAAALWWRQNPGGTQERSAAKPAGSPATPVAPSPAPASPASAVPPLAGESRIADELNAPTGTIQRDLEILSAVFEMWQTNFAREGNPTGLNAEITAALTGDNAHRFAFIPPGHRAINASGELCDRWGTPFRFHALSGRHMEVASAGPDRRFGTADDVKLAPAATDGTVLRE